MSSGCCGPPMRSGARWGTSHLVPSAGRRRFLLRAFFCTSGRKIILLLSGYDKAKEPGHRRQERAITQARKLQAAHQEAERCRMREPRSGGTPV